MTIMSRGEHVTFGVEQTPIYEPDINSGVMVLKGYKPTPVAYFTSPRPMKPSRQLKSI